MWTYRLRRSVLFVNCVLSFSASGFSQTPSRPKKVLAPGQRAYQQQIREVNKQRESLRAEATQVFEAEMTRQKAGDCSNALTTLDANTCYRQEVEITDQNLRAYDEALRSLIGLQIPDFSGQTPPGPAGSRVTPEGTAEFDHTEQL